MSLTSRSDCDIQDIGGFEPKRFKDYCQKSFTVTCKKGRHTIECNTNSNSMNQNAAVQLQGVLYSTHNCMQYIHITCSYHSFREASKNRQPTM